MANDALSVRRRVDLSVFLPAGGLDRREVGGMRRAKTLQWRNLRKMTLMRDDCKCVRCGSEEDLQVHHKHGYAEGGEDDVDNLETVCEECHLKEHQGDPSASLMRGHKAKRERRRRALIDE